MARFARFGWGSVPAARAALSRLAPFQLRWRCAGRFWRYLRPAPLVSGRGPLGSRPFFVPLKCERSVNGLVGGWLLSVDGVSFLRFI